MTNAYDFGSGRPKPRKLPTDWPKIGGSDFKPGPTNLFLTPEFRDVFRPGFTRLVYAGASVGLGLCAKTAAIPIYKISTCAEDRLGARMAENGRDEYASYYYFEGDYVHEEGWDRWYPSHLHPQQRPSPNSPVQAAERCVKVHLPQSMSPEAFDAAFDAEVSKGAIHEWAMTPDAARHCGYLGVSPATLIRYTVYPGWRLSPALELAGFSIFTGADRIVSLAERIILEHHAISTVG